MTLYGTNVLIISKRKELSVKYKKLIEALNQKVAYTDDLSDALSIIQKQKVEFIIISDTIKEKLSEFISKIRVLTYNFRPIIIAVSKSNDLNDKIEALEKGADDFLGEEISKTEFQMRFKAHLRRFLESSLNPESGILGRNITLRALDKSLNEKNAAYLLIKIENFEPYKKTHGEIASQKVIRTLSAIVNSTLAKEDFIGHLSETEFLLITNALVAEKTAQFLTFAFDNILNKFYSDDEYENNFMLQSSESSKEFKEGLMKLLVSSLEKDRTSSREDVLNNLYELLKLYRESKNSTYVIDRVKLKGKTTTKRKKDAVLIYEPDYALSELLKNVCELNEMRVVTTGDISEFEKCYKSFSPDVVILDWGMQKETESLRLAGEISKDGVKLIFTSVFLNKKEILKAGADLYIPKPYEIDDMLCYIKKFLN